MIVELILIQLIAVYLTDVARMGDTLKEKLARHLHCHIARLRPFDCSLCLTWWMGLLWLLLNWELSLANVATVAALSATADLTATAFFTIKDIVIKILSRL